MARKRLDLNLLMILDALTKEQSVTLASKNLGVSQSSVSQSLSKLRDYFNDPLFLRERGGISPTDFVTRITPRLHEVMKDIDDLLTDEIEFNPSSSERVITICTPDAGELALLPLLARKLSTVAPKCRLRTINVDVINLDLALEEAHADLVVTGAAVATSQNILQQRVARHGFLVVAHPNSPVDGTISTDEFRACRHIIVNPTGYHVNTVNQYLQDLGLRPIIAVETIHYLTVPYIISANPDLVAVLPDYLAEHYAQSGIVKTLEADFDLPYSDVYHYYHKRTASNPFSIWLRSLLRECHKEWLRERM